MKPAPTSSPKYLLEDFQKTVFSCYTAVSIFSDLPCLAISFLFVIHTPIQQTQINYAGRATLYNCPITAAHRRHIPSAVHKIDPSRYLEWSVPAACRRHHVRAMPRGQSGRCSTVSRPMCRSMPRHGCS